MRACGAALALHLAMTQPALACACCSSTAFRNVEVEASRRGERPISTG
jgi:hypothetical protein